MPKNGSVNFTVTKESFDEEGIEIPFPHCTVVIKQP